MSPLYCSKPCLSRTPGCWRLTSRVLVSACVRVCARIVWCVLELGDLLNSSGVKTATASELSSHISLPRTCGTGTTAAIFPSQVKERHNVRILRQTERELIPLGKGTVEKVKLLRTARLRKKVNDHEPHGVRIVWL